MPWLRPSKAGGITISGPLPTSHTSPRLQSEPVAGASGAGRASTELDATPASRLLRLPPWSPILVALVGCAVTVGLWQLLLSVVDPHLRHHLVGGASLIVLVPGFVVSLLLGLVLRMAIVSRRQFCRAERLNGELESEARTRRATEHRFRLAITCAPHPIMISNDRGEILHISEAVTHLTGYTHEEIPTLDAWTKRAYGERADEVRSLISRLIESDQEIPNICELPVNTRDGEQRTWLFSSAPLGCDEHGSRLRMTTALDITDHKHVETERRTVVSQLNERVKELTALHEAMKILQQDSPDLHTVLEKIVALLPPAWQYPERTAARIRYGSIAARTPGFELTRHHLQASFTTSDGVEGTIEIVYLNPPDDADDPYLPEERHLINSLADMLRVYIDRVNFQQRLEHSEHRLELAVRGSNDGLWDVNLRTGQTWYAPKFMQLLGCDEEEMLSDFEFLLARVHPEDREATDQALRRNLEDKTRCDIEHRLKCGEGEYRWFHTRAKTLRDAEGQAIRLSGCIQDITDRKLANEEQERLAMVLEATIDFVATVTEDGRLRYINSAGRRMIGLESDQPLQRTHFQDICPDWACDVLLNQAIPAAIERGVWSGETALINPLGYEVPVSQVVIAHKNDAGQLKYISTIVRDISDRKLTEEVLRESRQTLASRLAAIEAAQEAIVITNTQGLIDYVNPAFTRITGYHPSEVLGRRTSILKSGRHKPSFYKELWDTIIAGESWHGVIINRRKDGTLYPEEQTITPVRNNEGEIVRFVSIKRDVTEQRKNEESQRQRKALQQAVSAMEQVLGVVGHELRTPLAALRATTEFLLTDMNDFSQQQQAFLKTIHDQTISMAEMVNNLLEAARLNSGCARWNWQTVDLTEACDAAFNIVENLVDTEHVKLQHHVEPEGLTMRGDFEAVRRLLINLLSNAAKHTSEGSIRVNIRRVVQAEHPYVRIQVTDTGEGIDEQVLRKLGQAFVLNSGAVGSDYVRGTGLGLAICRGIVAAHGGEITVDSVVGRGATFTVTMRADLQGPNQAHHQIAIRRESAA